VRVALADVEVMLESVLKGLACVEMLWFCLIGLVHGIDARKSKS